MTVTATRGCSVGADPVPVTTTLGFAEVCASTDVGTGVRTFGDGLFGDCYFGGAEVVSSGYVDLPGTTGNTMTTPDAAPLDILGDITIVARIALDDWTPALTATIVSKRVSNTQNSYRLQVATNGALQFITSPDGTDTAQITMSSSAVVAATDGTWKWVAGTLDVDDGAGNRVARFWTSDDGATWTQLGTTTTTAGTTSLFSSTSLIEIGATTNGTQNRLVGLVSHVSIRDGIGAAGVVGGTEVFRFDSDSLLGVSPSATTFTSSDTGNRWVAIPSTVGNFIGIPDPTQLAAATQIDVRWVERAPSTGAAGYTSGQIIGQAISNVSGICFYVLSGGGNSNAWPRFSIDGVNFPGTSSFVAIRPTTGILALRFTWRGSDGRVQAFTKAATSVAGMLDNTGWVQFGVDQTGPTGTLFNSASPLNIGSASAGKYVAASVATTIDGAPFYTYDAAANLAGVALAATSFTATTGQTITVTRSGSPQTELVTGRSTITVNRSGSPATTIVPTLPACDVILVARPCPQQVTPAASPMERLELVSPCVGGDC